MSWFEQLKNFVETNLDIDINIGGEMTQIENVRIVNGVTGPPAGLEEDDDTLYVDSEALDDDEERELQSVIYDGWEEEEGIYQTSTRRDMDALKSAENADRIEETLNFFGPKISTRYYGILESALYLRELWERESHTPREVMSKRRKDIAETYGQDSYKIINLCSAGYFDEGRYLRVLYHELKKTEGWKEGQYQEAFDEIVQNQAFTVFVSATNSIYSIKSDIVAKARQRRQYTVEMPFVDVRGMGHENREKIQEAIGLLEEEYSDVSYEEERDEAEIVIRIEPESISDNG